MKLTGFSFEDFEDYPNTVGLEPHPAQPAARMPMVVGRCPACNLKGSLFLAQGGCVTCSSLSCPDPGAATHLLQSRKEPSA